MKLEDFLKTKYDFLPGDDNSKSIKLSRDGKKAHVIILEQWKQHFYDMGDRGNLTGNALKAYKEKKI